jgi:hypothetical protein
MARADRVVIIIDRVVLIMVGETEIIENGEWRVENVLYNSQLSILNSPLL